MKAGVDYIGITTPFYCHDGNGNFLFHKRSTKCRDEHGKWDCGGGQLEHGLTSEQNVLKEIMEEYGCAGIIEDQLPAHSVFREWEGQKTHWLSIPFIVRVNPEEVKNGDPEYIDEIAWFTLENLPEPIHTGFSYTFNRFKHFFERFLKKG